MFEDVYFYNIIHNFIFIFTLIKNKYVVYIKEMSNDVEVEVYYYSTKENKSWSDILFTVTYKCFGILNLNHLLTDKLFEYLNDVFYKDKL